MHYNYTADHLDVSAPSTRPHHYSWAALLARVFALDVTVCPACGGRPHIEWNFSA